LKETLKSKLEKLQGKTTKEVCAILNIKPNLVSSYVNKFYFKYKRVNNEYKDLKILAKEMTVPELCKYYNVPRNTMESILNKHKLKRKKTPKHLIDRHNNRGGKEAIEFNNTNREYIEKHTMYESSSYFNVSYQTVIRWCKKHNIKPKYMK